MPLRFDLLIFDWDGTLFDSTAIIARAIQDAARDLSLPIPTEEVAKSVIGRSLPYALQEAIPELASAQIPAITERYRHHYFQNEEAICLFDGVPELLKTLQKQGYLLAVATGKARKGLNIALDRSGLAPFFNTTRCADETASKPDPQMLLEIMDELKVTPERTLMIGDTTHDLLTAKNAGVSSLGVSYSAQTKAALAPLAPLAICQSISEMSAWFAALTKA